jgi:hypothetical protein
MGLVPHWHRQWAAPMMGVRKEGRESGCHSLAGVGPLRSKTYFRIGKKELRYKRCRGYETDDHGLLVSRDSTDSKRAQTLMGLRCTAGSNAPSHPNLVLCRPTSLLPCCNIEAGRNNPEVDAANGCQVGRT